MARNDSGLVTALRAARLRDGEPADIRARKVGLGKSTYDPIEQGRLQPTAQTAKVLETAFGLPIEQLLKRVDPHRTPKLPKLVERSA